MLEEKTTLTRGKQGKKGIINTVANVKAHGRTGRERSGDIRTSESVRV